MLHSPWFRIPFLGFALVATVATSDVKSWAVDTQTPGELTTLEGKKRLEVRFDVSTNPYHSEIQLNANIAWVDPKANLLVVLTCGSDEKVGGTTKRTTGPLDVYAKCAVPGDRVTLAVENLDDETTFFSWHLLARAYGDGSNDKPKDAFISLTKVE